MPSETLLRHQLVCARAVASTVYLKISDCVERMGALSAPTDSSIKNWTDIVASLETAKLALSTIFNDSQNLDLFRLATGDQELRTPPTLSNVVAIDELTNCNDDNEDSCSGPPPLSPSSPPSVFDVTFREVERKPMTHTHWINVAYAGQEDASTIETLEENSLAVVREFANVLRILRIRSSSKPKYANFDVESFLQVLCGNNAEKRKNEILSQLFRDFYECMIGTRKSWHVKDGVDAKQFKALLLDYGKSKRAYTKKRRQRQKASTPEDNNDTDDDDASPMSPPRENPGGKMDKHLNRFKFASDYSSTSSTKRKRL
ncbi:MAG: hypothetical protein BVN35_05990 [Proteobacteria bacterium ST_bin11]|nr:MAG: hypothetical protein BVN35_05990 [Proteobacteria bacterium ST_bin11]